MLLRKLPSDDPLPQCTYAETGVTLKWRNPSHHMRNKTGIAILQEKISLKSPSLGKLLEIERKEQAAAEV
jgi:hypothetical protein